MHRTPSRPHARNAALALFAALLAAFAFALTACGSSEEETDAFEGEPIELGNLKFNVQLTRLLNPDDVEDKEYLAGQPDPPAGSSYLGVFLEVENEGDETVNLPSVEDMEIVDTTGAVFSPIDTDTVFGFPFGEPLLQGEAIPIVDSAAASGPVNGAILIFLIDNSASENRPVELEISADGEQGQIELDL